MTAVIFSLAQKTSLKDLDSIKIDTFVKTKLKMRRKKTVFERAISKNKCRKNLLSCLGEKNDNKKN